MTDQHQGGCACGTVRYRLEDVPIVVNCCHCTDCQRETGSAFALNAVIEADRVTLLAEAPVASTIPSESGQGQVVWRCPDCQVALWSNFSTAGPRLHFVRVGTLDDQGAFPPDAHIYVRSKRPWVVLPDGARTSEGFYNPREIWSAESMARFKAAMTR